MGALLGRLGIGAFLARIGRPIAAAVNWVTFGIFGVALFRTAGAVEKAAPWLAVAAVAWAANTYLKRS